MSEPLGPLKSYEDSPGANGAIVMYEATTLRSDCPFSARLWGYRAHEYAALFASAPTMREALRELWEAVKDYGRIGFEGSRLLEAMSEARVILAAADKLI